jgi:uncharacterized membrane protein
MAYDQDKDPAYKLMQYVTAVMMSAVLLLWAYIAYVEIFEISDHRWHPRAKQQELTEQSKRRMDKAATSSGAIFICYLAILALYIRAGRRGELGRGWED